MNSLNSNLARRAGPIGLAVAVFVIAGCATPPPAPVLSENRDEVTATITAIYPDTRLVSLLTDEGRPLTIVAGDEVANLEAMAVGDRVTASYYEAVAAEVTDAPPGGGEESELVSRAPEGNLPGGSRTRTSTVVVTIDSVDPNRNRVRFTNPDGHATEVTVYRPELQAFVERLQRGDRVRVTYNDAVAVSLMPAD